jgi:hypothetical protein
MENIEMQFENVSLSSVKEKILSIDDVYDFCQKQSKETIFNFNNEHCTVYLPHYKLSDELQKENLFSYCFNHPEPRYYIPDNIKCEYIERDLLVSVSIFNQ